MTRPGFALPRPGFALARPALGDQDTEPGDPEPLADDATVDLTAERAGAGVGEILDALESDLIGLQAVKTRIREIAALLLVDRARSRFGLSAGPRQREPRPRHGGLYLVPAGRSSAYG